MCRTQLALCNVVVLSGLIIRLDVALAVEYSQSVACEAGVISELCLAHDLRFPVDAGISVFVSLPSFTFRLLCAHVDVH